MCASEKLDIHGMASGERERERERAENRSLPLQEALWGTMDPDTEADASTRLPVWKDFDAKRIPDPDALREHVKRRELEYLVGSVLRRHGLRVTDGGCNNIMIFVNPNPNQTFLSSLYQFIFYLSINIFYPFHFSLLFLFFLCVFVFVSFFLLQAMSMIYWISYCSFHFSFYDSQSITRSLPHSLLKCTSNIYR